MQVIGYSLGEDGSFSYKTEAGLFDAYPDTVNGIWVIYRTRLGDTNPYIDYEVGTRKQAIQLIDTILAIHRI